MRDIMYYRCDVYYKENMHRKVMSFFDSGYKDTKYFEDWALSNLSYVRGNGPTQAIAELVPITSEEYKNKEYYKHEFPLYVIDSATVISDYDMMVIAMGYGMNPLTDKDIDELIAHTLPFKVKKVYMHSFTDSAKEAIKEALGISEEQPKAETINQIFGGYSLCGNYASDGLLSTEDISRIYDSTTAINEQSDSTAKNDPFNFTRPIEEDTAPDPKTLGRFTL